MRDIFTKGIKENNHNLSLLIAQYFNTIYKINACSSENDNACNEIGHVFNEFYSKLKTIVNFDSITKNQLEILGCYKTTTGGSTNGAEIFLIPEYLLPLLPIGLKVIEFHDGREIIYDGSNISNYTDTDGYLSVGISILDIKK